MRNQRSYTLRGHHLDSLGAYMIDQAAGNPFIPEMVKKIRGKEYGSFVTGAFDDILANPDIGVMLTNGFGSLCRDCPDKRDECSTSVVGYDNRVMENLGLKPGAPYRSGFIVGTIQGVAGGGEYARLKAMHEASVGSTQYQEVVKCNNS